MSAPAPNYLSSSSMIRQNTFISEHYIDDWNPKDGIREVLQNQYDAINEKIGKSNVIINPKGTDRLNAFEFEFRDKNNNDLLGEITYDERYKELKVWNVGYLETADLLLGCQKHEKGKTNKDIIGRFGEGMKLAALSFLKENMGYRILTSGQEWRFKIEEDPFFKTGNKAQKCLFLYRENLSGETFEKYKDKVTVIISGLDKKIWVDKIDDFLWLTQKEIGKVTVKNEKNEYLGEILLGEKFCHKNYVKEIYVDKIAGNFGLNLDIQLDRDRNCIPNLHERNSKAQELISNVLRNLKKDNDTTDEPNLAYLDQFNAATKDLLKTFPLRIYQSLKSGNDITQYLYTKLGNSDKGGTLLFYEWEYDWKQNKENPEGKQPGYSAEIYKFLNERKLDPSFYPFLGYHNWYLFNCLAKSIRYLSISNKFNNYTKNSSIAEIPNNFKNIINNIVQKVKIAKNDFSENNMKFKKYTHKDNDFVYYENNIIYFSYSLFELPEKNFKYFVFSKCLELNNINLKAISEKYNLI